MSITFPQAFTPRDASQAAILEAIDRQLVELAKHFGAKPMVYPSLISNAALERAEYPSAFPHLLMAATSLALPEQDGPALLSPANYAAAQWYLSPAVCYHCYASLAGQCVSTPLTLTARGRCFRHEAWNRPGVRQIEFDMREIVFIGAKDWVDDAALQAKTRMAQLIATFIADTQWEVGEDPFFLPRAQGKALMQRLGEMKLELIAPGGNSDRQPGDPPDESAAHPLVAVASVNRHGTFFGDRFDIRLPTGEPVHTACAAFGLDRLAAYSQLPSHQSLATPGEIQ